MPRDYKHRAQKRPPRRPLPAWLWLLTGLLLGGFLAALFWLRGQSAEPGGEWVGARPDRPPQGQPGPASPRDVPPPPKPRFDFYDLLPKMEVVVPEEELTEPEPEPARTAPPPESSPAAAPAAAYLVQVGSFRRAEDADRLRAQLTLLGFDARVAAARLDAGEMRYRVRTGPYAGRQALAAARQRLATNGFDGIVIKARP